MRNTILNLLNEFGPSFNSLFLQAARELGIISDAIIASPGENDRSDERQQYIQGNLNWHHQDSFSGLFSSHEGLLNDRRNGECQCVQEEIYATSVIFDIDLDYFTYSWEGRRYPVPNQIISRILAENQPMREIRNIYAVTIALEPNYCGGLAHSQEILQAVLFSLTGLSNSIDVRHLCPNSINANYIEGHFDDD